MSTKSDSQKIIENSTIIEENNEDLNELATKIANLPSRGSGTGGVSIDDLPIATNDMLGVVKIGEGISVTDEGEISVRSNTILTMTGEQIYKAGSDFSGTVLCLSDYDEIKSGTIYGIENGEIVSTIAVAGGGGGQLNTNTSTTISELEQSVAINSTVILKYNFETTAVGKGTAKLLVNGVLKSSKIVNLGENEFDVSQYIKEGTNYLTITISDSNNSTITFDYIINGISLTLKSNFNANIVYTTDISYRYSVIGVGEKTIYFVIDNNEPITTTTKSSGDELNYIITGLNHGIHSFTVYATTTLNGEIIKSNELKYKIIFAQEGVTTPIISSNFSQTTAMQGELLNIDYLVYDPTTSEADITLQINNEVGVPAKVDRTVHYWGINNYPIGDVVFKIICKETVLEIPVKVEEVKIDIEPITENMQLYLSAANRSNTELADTISVWNYNNIEAQLTGFNWVSNGWMNGILKLTGEAKIFIPFNIFAEDLRMTGKTIEFEFSTHNVSNLSSILISCYTEKKGIQITSTECIMSSEQQTIKVKFKENEKLRISIVVDDINTNRLIKTYINGVLSGIAQYSTQDNFQQNSPVGITINQDGEEIDISTIRIYSSALTSRNILNNYICDIVDVSEKLLKYNSNNVYDIYGNISLAKLRSMIPILQVTGALPSVKGDKKTVSVVYNDPFDPTLNFEYSNCTIDIQGTSSQYYPKKNYKFKFPEAFSFYKGAIPEKEYTFKADYMESSHTHNTGNAVFINELYEEMFPTRTEDNGVRDCIYGFPCAIFYRASADADYEYFGAYNFNNDKSNSDTLGLTTDKAESWEFCNNTSSHCLLRNDDFSESSGVSDNFEARYPEEYEDNPDYTALRRVVSWIVSTDGDIDKFKEEFNQYFNMYYCLIYYVIMEFATMVDSRAKNMFFDTVDGLIWYPRFYDMDTSYGLNNEGVLDFGYGLEMHDSIGTLKVWNGENSLFWNNFEQAFSKEIKEMYCSLRASKKLSYDAIMKVFKEHQIDMFSEAEYNEDARFKYISPILENNDTTYLYTAQGTRLSHLQWWVDNRIKYLDSKYETSEYISDFITMRLYTENGNFNLVPYTDTYATIKFGSTVKKERAKAGQQVTVLAPTDLVFNDTETIIYGGSNISDLGDLSNKYAGTVDVSKASKLKRLIIGNGDTTYQNTNLKTLSLGNNTLLTNIDIQNCPNLTGNLDISGCTKLYEFLAQGTGLTGVTFTDGGDLKVVRLPETLTSLIIKNQQSIEELTIDGYLGIETLILKNTNINVMDILVNALNLKRLYCYFPEEINAEFRCHYFDYLIQNCGGIDDNNINTQYPNIRGYITIVYDSDMTEDEISTMQTNYEEKFPELNITYKSALPYYYLTYSASTGTITVEFDDTKNGKQITDKMIVMPTKEYILNKFGQDGTYTKVNVGRFYMRYTNHLINTILIPSGYDAVNVNASAYIDFRSVKNFVSIDGWNQYCISDMDDLTTFDFVQPEIWRKGDDDRFYTSGFFHYCSNLKRIYNYSIKDALPEIMWMNSLEELDFTGSDNIIYDVTLYDCPKLKLKNIEGKWLRCGVSRIYNLREQEGELNIIARDTYLDSAMRYMQSLETINIDCSNMTSIFRADSYANTDTSSLNFEQCLKLKTINLINPPETLGYIKGFHNCPELTAEELSKYIDFSQPLKMRGDALVYMDKLDLTGTQTLIANLYLYANNSTYIYAFNRCPKLNVNKIIMNVVGLYCNNSTPTIYIISGEWAQLSCKEFEFNWVPTEFLGKIVEPKDITLSFSNGSWSGTCTPETKLEKVTINNADMIHNSIFWGKSTYLKEFIIKDYGKGFLTTATENQYSLNLGQASALTYDAIINLFTNGIYDIASLGIVAQKIVLEKTVYAMLSEEDIAIATSKGWNVVQN